MADEQVNGKRSEELRRKIEAARQQAFDEEEHRIEAEAQRRADQSIEANRQSEEKQTQEKLREAQRQRQREEQAVLARANEVGALLEKERTLKKEKRQREEEERLRREEEERRVNEELQRKKVEEEEQKRREEELTHAGMERTRREEEIRRLQEERRRRVDEEKTIRVDEQQRQDEERLERIRTQLANARTFLSNADYDQALVEVAKALVNDPTNAEALALETTIREAQGKPAVTPQPEETTPKRRKVTPRLPSGIPSQKKPSRSGLYIGIAIAIVVIIAGTILLTKRHNPKGDVTFAVIPWTSTTNTAEDNSIAAGLTEVVTRRFESLTSRSALGYNSVRDLTHRNGDPRQGVFDLGYRYVLEGKLERNSKHVALHLRLANSSGNSVWSETFEEPPAMISNLAEKVADKFSTDMGLIPSEPPRSEEASQPAVNSAAYISFLRGLALMRDDSPESYNDAYASFGEALTLEPNWCEALAAASIVLSKEFEKGWKRADSILEQSKLLADGAVATDTSSWRGHYALGRILTLRHKFSAALEHFDAALRHAPNNSDIYLAVAEVYNEAGQYNRAIEILQYAYLIDPSNPEVASSLGTSYQLMHSAVKALQYHNLAASITKDSVSYLVSRFADAVTPYPELRLKQGERVVNSCYRALNAQPEDYVTLYCLSRLRQVSGSSEADSLLDILERMLINDVKQRPHDARVLAFLAKTLTRLGRFDEASTLIRRAVDIDTSDTEIKYKAAQIYSMQMLSKGNGAQRKGLALAMLRQAIARNFRLEEVTDPDFFNMFDQPEFRTTIQLPIE